MNRYGLLIGLLLLLASCRAKPGTAEAKEAVPADSTVVQSQTQFPFPEIPATLTEPKARKSYLLTHYWERFDFADTTLVNNRDVTEQGFVNFIALLVDGTTSEELTRESLKNWCTGFIAKDHARRVLTKTADDYLFNPNSPFYNEALYGVYLETMLGVLPPDDAQRSTCDFRLKLVRRNNPGDRATDFYEALAAGGVGLLVLWRTNADVRQNALVTAFVYLVAVAVGLLVAASGILL